MTQAQESALRFGQQVKAFNCGWISRMDLLKAAFAARRNGAKVRYIECFKTETGLTVYRKAR